jgi:hypothetical protein
MRENDQAALVSGALRLATGESSIVSAPFYNYDKQYGTYLALAGLVRLFPKADPVLLGNLFSLLSFVVAGGTLAFYRPKYRPPPPAVLIPVLLCPALVLFISFLGSSLLSLACLLLGAGAAFRFRGNCRTVALAACVILAVSFRADAVLVIPAIILSTHSRRSLSRMVRDPHLWTILLAGGLPLLLGRIIARTESASFAPFFVPKAFAAFIVFGFGPAQIVLLGALFAWSLLLGVRSRRQHWYYPALGLSLLLPLAFYSIQLHSPRYFYPTLAAMAFAVASRRFCYLWSGSISTFLAPRRARGAVLVTVVLLAVIPFLVGLRLPVLSRPRPVVGKATVFPTADGGVPMGAYAEFLLTLRFRGHLIDHNNRIWRSALSVDFHPCEDGAVQIADSPMANYLELAVRLRGQVPRIVKEDETVPCPARYVDSRSVTRTRSYARGYGLGSLLEHSVDVVSRTDNGQPILSVNLNQSSSTESTILMSLQEAFEGEGFEVFEAAHGTGPFTMTVESPYKYAVFAEESSCTASPHLMETRFMSRPTSMMTFDAISLDAPVTLSVICPHATAAGWARTVVPPYMRD